MFERVVLAVGMPRSGTSWLSQIIDSSPDVRFRLSPLFSYEYKNRLCERSTRSEWMAVLEGAYESSNEFMDQSHRRSAGQYPTFLAKRADPPVLALKDTRFHNLTERALDLLDDLKVVALVRHPCGAIHSWLTAPREFPGGADPRSEWRSGAVRKTGYGEFWGFDDWKEITRQHLRLEQTHPDRFLLVRYEDLVREAGAQTRRLFDFLGLDVTEQTLRFLADSQATHVESEYAVYKRPEVKDRWRTGLDPDIRETILAEVAGTELERFCT